MATYKANHTYQNWARTLKFKPERFAQPASEDEVVEIVNDALAFGHHVRTHGGTHSWSDLVVTDSTLINLDKIKDGTADLASQRYTVGAGIRLKHLIDELADAGLALANIGSITEQSIAGAISTGTHGTGLGLQNMSQSIVGMRLVTGTGQVLVIDEGDAALLEAARVSLGVLGIITEVTIECVPLYDLEYTAYWCKLDDVVDEMDTLNQQNVRFLLWWLVTPFGPKDNAVVVTMNPPGTSAGMLGAGGSAPGGTVDRAPLPLDTNDVFGFLSSLFPNQPFQQIIKHTGRYDEILTIPLLPVLHREFEYALPVPHASEALRQLKRIFDEGDVSTTLPVEVRFVARDESLLSPARGMDVCYIGVSTQPNANEVYARVEPLMKDLGGRPHWGKHFSLRQSEVEEMYPGSYGAFRQVRGRLDPTGIFGNTLLRELLDY